MKKYRKSKRYYYFRNQKLLGVALLICSAISAIVCDGDITALLLIVPLGLYMIFTKEAITYGDYYYELQSKNEKEDS